MRLRQSSARYRPVSRIAVGGMAEVWKAEAIFPEGDVYHVAIKRGLPEMGDPLYRTMFEDEARLGMRLRHPRIVRVYDARDIGGTFIMVMELVEGDTLKGLFERAHARSAPMPVPPALYIALALAEALAYAHDAEDDMGHRLGVVHRDVSPHNLLLGRDGKVKLTDFGLADASLNQSAREGMVGGKLGYLAPEVIEGRRADYRIDLFALGVVLWETLAGRSLFQGRDDAETVRNVVRCEVPSLRTLHAAVPPGVEALAKRLLDRDPARRLQSAQEACHALNVLIERVDPDVGARDIALMVGLHLALKSHAVEREAEPLELIDLISQEMDAFAQAAAGGASDLGAAPLDPGEFDLGSLPARALD